MQNAEPSRPLSVIRGRNQNASRVAVGRPEGRPTSPLKVALLVALNDTAICAVVRHDDVTIIYEFVGCFNRV